MGFWSWLLRRKGKPATAESIASSPSRRWRYGPDGKTKFWVD